MRWIGRGSKRGTKLTELEERLATAGQHAQRLTEAGMRCDRAVEEHRFCYWKATVLSWEYGGTSAVAVRCARHPGGRFTDHEQPVAMPEPPAP